MDTMPPFYSGLIENTEADDGRGWSQFPEWFFRCASKLFVILSKLVVKRITRELKVRDQKRESGFGKQRRKNGWRFPPAWNIWSG